MLINWCLKGIPSGPHFGDNEAEDTMKTSGILSNWMRFHSGWQVDQANAPAQSALNIAALDNHVNNYVSVQQTTPYISLSAGCQEYLGTATPSVRYKAYTTALEFATNSGRVDGYIYRCWVITAPQVAAELPSIADEVRDLNLFPHFNPYHVEGEIAAKLLVPVAQIQCVLKVSSKSAPLAWTGHRKALLMNPSFKNPQTISNLIPELL